MIELFGGEKAFIANWDQLFNEDSDVGNYVIDISGLIGQYAHGNEPCHHVGYLMPWLAPNTRRLSACARS